MSVRNSLLALAVLSMALTIPSGTAEPDLPLPEVEKCAPPCGDIVATIGVHTDMTRDDLMTSKIGDLPEVIPVRITYFWDMDQEGTGVPGDADEMTITIVIIHSPTWIRASLDPMTCSFRLIPAISEYDVCTLELSIEVDPQYVPTTEDELDLYGKRLMLLATSRESGTFRSSYGIEDMRWRYDEAPTLDGMIDRPLSTQEAPMPLLVPALTILGLAALAASRRRL